MTDLHTHTNESDGTDSPEELLAIAARAGVSTLAITDHDTFAGYDAALALGRRDVELICGVELSCVHGPKTVHLLAYFIEGGPPRVFRDWVDGIVASRRERNERLIARLQAMGVQITLGEVEAVGRTITGRPHFARVLVEKGYATDRNDAFHRWIGEEGAAFVERNGPSLAEAIDRVKSAGGISSLAHPVRIGMHRNPEAELALFAELREAGLDAIEVYHSDHSPVLTRRYAEFAALLGLLETGGSDYHGANKVIALGSVPAPDSVVAGLKARYSST